MRFYQNEKKKKNHFAMIGGILNFISFCGGYNCGAIIMINNCLKPYSPLTFQVENTSIIM